MTVSGTLHVHTPIAGLVDLALRDPALQEIARRAGDRPADLNLVGPASARVFVASALAQPGLLLVVTATGREADDLTAELRGVFGDAVALFPSWETLPHERLSPGVDTVGARMMLLRRLTHPDDARLGPPLRIVVTTARSLLQPMAPDLAEVDPVTLTVGGEADFDAVVARLVDLAYSRVDMVGKRGEFAVRGGILDVFPPTAEHPVRVEFWGDEVSEMRMFSVADQRSIPEIEIDTLIAVPCRELLLTAEVRDRAAALASEHPVLENSVTGSVPDMLAKLAEGIPVDGMEALLPLLRPSDFATLPDHLPEGTPLLVCDPEKVRTRAADLIKTGREFLEASWSTAAVGGDVPIDIEALGVSGYVGYGDARDAARAGGHPWWTLSQLDSGAGESTALDIRPAPSARGQQHNLDEIFAMLRAHVATGGFGVVVTPGSGTAMRVVEQLSESDIPATVLEPGAVPGEGVVGVIKGPLHDGVVIPGANLVVITETDLTGNRAAATEGKKLAAKRRNVVDPLALTAGDLVVHDQHGIGRFVEMTERVIGGARREYLVLEYASAKRGGGSDRLYVPMDSLDQLSRYVGGEAPTLSRLGGSDWANTKTKARKAVREIAAELVALYAKRQASAGHAFAPDTPWQREMEDAFGFTETVDQLTAITEVKSDMEKPVPMDRVICGDVGYGKTEIAVRAAFKAVQDGKQVAVLVPTTLLADQHLQTFTNRMTGFPVTVKGLSRFTDPAESRATIEGMKDGSVDIVIGTHRLLQTGVTWKDLGLVIVDEEQRFGVEHKEHIKSMRTHVDVLTMSATPIPRTLEMSLAGIREMSTILTPPEERYPVLTYVGPHDDKQVAAALRREMLRDGQAFYIHNRVRTIDSAAAKVRQLVPEARVVVAHGQMPEEQLEKTVEGFWNREYDILVCTTIVETGLDISNANTLIVERADTFGLSQLHQLRGRVGRSRERGYAYFLYPPEVPLTETAYDRLATIAQNNELGAGMAVAMKDLEIRGAGNVLGAEQSGHVAGVGFDLYVRLVGEAVEAYRAAADGKTVAAPEEPKDVRIDLPVDAHLPPDYIGSDRLRLEAYRRLAAAPDDAAVDAVIEELVDRYGPLPEPAQRLVAVARLRLLARAHGVTEIGAPSATTLRISPMTLPDSAQLRLKRLYSGANYRATTSTVQVPVPRAGSGVGSPRIRDLELVAFVAGLLLAIDGKPGEEVDITKFGGGA
ncbi:MULTISPECIES: transcription-repair coupling factor [Mycolicibacterium]|jgi:transcription-repair coupling factor (superfamily II helicase)|uniref:Transcription-repair-coupling factor n=4 Tax=Mycolicibacterium TaxID=1866885 RepID=A1TEF0_MYCVP|nr:MULTISPECIES: transcription-repair coupling factor [Mycolicibacterium]ABM15550.1 transcription-repair coupling factor [Mycolicibacterium vanbaalenii PYR-1]MCV7130896.1 transcription-repair coupling factor [Mycolicibacterium vanbaalenii PYR-1]MDN4522220.1 transcription-repair coupling factor [Mycolicibacterium austroafricanum]QRZ05819.1 transcription-repair coupling factor [Mycolicibacterium austroafricanum]QZT55927.1 transcription-repair coupling factor [Mycolicibacterium austroafricanum]